MRSVVKFIAFVLMSLYPAAVFGGVNMDLDNGGAMGLPFSTNMIRNTEADTSICPAGARTVAAFIEAWKHEDFKQMYDLLTDESKEKYPYQETRFTFQFLEYREYTIVSVKRNGDNFDFIIGAGSWKEGDKENKKIIIDGKSFKIIMQSMNSPFKESAASHF